MENFLEEPEAIANLDRAELAALFVKIRACEGAVLAKFLTGGDQAQADRVLSIDDLVRLTGLSRRSLFKKARSLSFVTRVSRTSLVGSEAGLKRWMAARRRGA